MKMKLIKDIVDDKERAFYGSNCVEFNHITIDGPADGESAFKECSNIEISDSTFNLRYPLWHNSNLKVKNSTMSKDCRAALWYDSFVTLEKVNSEGIKALRECKNVTLIDSKFVSDEIFWNVQRFFVSNSTIESVYAFFGSSDGNIEKMHFNGKYSFQYTKNIVIKDSVLDTKDAFWHSKNVTCINCDIKGEYLAWYSKNLTLINCHISGTQPLCYAKGLKMVDCTMDNCDLSFEYSEVKGNVVGDVVSIKNPLKGKLKISGKTTYISDENDHSKGKFVLIN